MKIYHFTKLNIAIEKIIPNMALKFNSIRKTNDPREYYAWSFIGENEDGASEKDYANSVFKAKSLRENCKILCFNKEKAGYKNLMIWAHYGDNHRGVCLEINEEKFLETNKDLFDKQKYFFYDKIRYKKEEYTPDFRIPNVRENRAESFFNDYYKELFFTKSECWQEEQEWRILIKANENINLICNLTDSLEKVIIGLNFPWVYLPSLEYLCELSNIPLYRSFYFKNKIRIYKHTRGNYKPEFHQQFDED